jgi:hypothetical protein
MIRRAVRFLALSVATLLACFSLAVSNAPTARAATTTQTPVMGPSLLTANQLSAWYYRHHGSNQPKIPVLNNNVAQLAQIFIDVGRAEGVRGDMAFVQSMVETGWLGFTGSQITPQAYNYAGIFAFDGRAGLANVTPCTDSAPSRCMGTPQHGALLQIQLLRSYADPTAKTAPNRQIAAPSDRAGMAPLWEYFGWGPCPCGKLIWASSPDYGLTIIRLYSQALAESGKGGACVPYAPAPPGATSGNGYYEVTGDQRVSPFGTASYFGDLRGKNLGAPLVGGATASHANGYWLLGRDGGIFTFGQAKFFGSTGAMRLNRPVNGLERTGDDGGYWLVADDGGVFTFGNARFFGSTGALRLNSPIMGMARTVSGSGYWLFAADGGIFTFGDAGFFGSLGSARLSAPVVGFARTRSGLGYLMMTANGRMYRFGDAQLYGDMAACSSSLGGAARLLRSPSGNGYWIATGSGAILPFGDARRLGFPASIAGGVAAFMGAG